MNNHFNFDAILKDAFLYDVVDAEFTEITDNGNQMSAADKAMRARQIVEAADKTFRGVSSPLSRLLYGAIFDMGATWADDNPDMVRKPKFDRNCAVAAEFARIYPVSNTDVSRDPILRASLLLVFTTGVDWAKSHPCTPISAQR